jgi:putative ABC transport system substrate-binding protein
MTVNSADKFDSAFNEAIQARSDALAVSLSALFSSHQKQLVSLATNVRLPAIYTREEFIENGGLMSYGADQDEPAKRIAAMIDKILRGVKPLTYPSNSQKSLSLSLISKQPSRSVCKYHRTCWRGQTR